MSTKNPEQFKEWQERADEDFGSAKLLLEHECFPAVVCFHVHQVVEKYLKGYLAYNNFELEKTHQLDVLLEEIAIKIDEEFRKYKDEAVSLNDYYIETRYPTDLRENILIEEAKEALEKASRIRDFVLSKVKVS